MARFSPGPEGRRSASIGPELREVRIGGSPRDCGTKGGDNFVDDTTKNPTGLLAESVD